MRFSFIVPVFNVGKSKLARCLESISESVLRYRELDPESDWAFELIIVNDCSPEWDIECMAVSEVLNPWEIETNVVSHVENKGLGAARNTGLTYASGDWVWFIDSDDYIEPERFFDLIHSIDLFPSSRVGIYQVGANLIDTDGISSPMYFNATDTHILTTKDILNRNNLIPPCVWSKIYRRKFLINNNLRNPEGVLFEDQETLVRTFDCDALVIVLKNPIYNYCTNLDSIMNSDWDYKHVLDAYKVIYRCKKFLKAYPKELYKNRLVEYQITTKKADEGFKKLSKSEKFKIKLKLMLECVTCLL